MQQQALSVLVAWVRLERAMDGFHAQLRKDFGITGLQLSVLRICSERPQLPLAALRKTLVMHAATLGQAIDELRRMGLVTVRTDPNDRRARMVALTEKGTALIAEAPLAGPLALAAGRPRYAPAREPRGSARRRHGPVRARRVGAGKEGRG